MSAVGLDFLDLLRKPQAPPGLSDVAPYSGEGPSRYGEAALQREAEAVATATTGRRNDTLNKAIFSLAQLVAVGHLDAERVHATLTNAARVCGLDDTEIQVTLRSGYNSGVKMPRDVPAPWETADVPDVVTLRVVTDDPSQDAQDPAGDGQDAETDPQAAVEQWVHQSLPILDWHALWADDEEDEWILEPLIPARRMVALYSPPKVGKSLLMLELAAAVAAGREVLGVRPEHTRRVLYVDFENDPRGDVRPRLQAMGYGPDDLSDLKYLSFPTLAALDSERGAMELLAAVATYDVELVVIDTLSRSVAGEENDNDTWLQFYRHTGLRLKQAKVACVRLDHAGKDVDKGQRGGSAKSGDVDAVWRMAAVADDTYSLTCEANRLPISEKYLTFERRALPHLHSAVKVEGRLAAWNAKVDAVIALMDDHGLPADTGRTRARELVKSTGLTASNQVLEEAIKRRKRAAEMTVLSARSGRGQVLPVEDDGQARAGGDR